MALEDISQNYWNVHSATQRVRQWKEIALQ